MPVWVAITDAPPVYKLVLRAGVVYYDLREEEEKKKEKENEKGGRERENGLHMGGEWMNL